MEGEREMEVRGCARHCRWQWGLAGYIPDILAPAQPTEYPCPEYSTQNALFQWWETDGLSTQSTAPLQPMPLHMVGAHAYNSHAYSSHASTCALACTTEGATRAPSLDPKTADNCAMLKVTDKPLNSSSQQTIPKVLTENMWNISTLPPGLEICISS